MTEPMNQPMQPPTSTGAPVGTATAAPPPPPEAAQLERLLFEVKKVIVGQDRAIERMLACMLAGGHCLLESVPGLAKTLSAETRATAVGDTTKGRGTPFTARVFGAARNLCTMEATRLDMQRSALASRGAVSAWHSAPSTSRRKLKGTQ